MTLVPTQALLDAAVGERRGVCAFNVLHLETAEALVAAAERTGIPLILQISENCVSFHGSLRPIAAATMALAEDSTVELAVHLDHAESETLAREAIDLGFGSVMFDGARLEYAENVAATRRIVESAHSAGVAVEAELGEIGGKDGAHAPGVRTDPIEAQSFALETGVDALAVAVGSSHAMTERTSSLDLPRISEIRRLVGVPLVLHGSSGVPNAEIAAGIQAGLTKINVSTYLNGFFTGAVRAALAGNPRLVDSRKYLGPGRDAVTNSAAELLSLVHGPGSAMPPPHPGGS
ncbi:class II fructose-bisphosphate aldolase [Leucobacter aridicollis]|uniref:Fructose-bisphosphate aldolase class II n=1 Tax=Leucobacter aridicollis TaxID=283878 RepID=A0A852R4J4_9MICO|nr:class II fructose-bisphosphate aldolase [Leucobacter aridicollis]MBL3683161.1 class II fructose-bisphosphate aldolase [Leucobacter aridicollis]NYD25389.1 fructose-bisphosphate aldolase class II [Leucobacter aridicollis]